VKDAQLFGWVLALAGIVPLLLARRALTSGEVTVGDKVSQTRYTREASPAGFWCGLGFYAVLGVALITCGVLAGVGILG